MVQAVDDTNSLWQLYGDLENGCIRGFDEHLESHFRSKMKCGRIIRLQHVNTHSWLHRCQRHCLCGNHPVTAITSLPFRATRRSALSATTTTPIKVVEQFPFRSWFVG